MLAEDLDSLVEFILNLAWHSRRLKNHQSLQAWLSNDALIRKIEMAFFESDDPRKTEAYSQAVSMLEVIRKR